MLRKTEAIWDSQDTARLRDLWDTDDPDPYYLAGEQENWFIGLGRYQRLSCATARVAEGDRGDSSPLLRDVSARLLAPGPGVCRLLDAH